MTTRERKFIKVLKHIHTLCTVNGQFTTFSGSVDEIDKKVHQVFKEFNIELSPSHKKKEAVETHA